MVVALLALVAGYLVRAVPFGWLIARSRGIDIFHAGSGNIGATNVGRVLGRKFGLVVFALDFAKGAVPVAVAGLHPAEAHETLGLPNALRVGVALCAFLGHLFPVYLGFRGGKGVATGAGTIFVLVSGPAALAVFTWVVVLLASRMVSLASLSAVTIMLSPRLLSAPAPFAADALPITLYLLAGTAAVM